jgi:hypothetical protein
MMMMADFAAPHAREERFGVVRIDLARQVICFLMVDPVQRVSGVQLVP